MIAWSEHAVNHPRVPLSSNQMNLDLKERWISICDRVGLDCRGQWKELLAAYSDAARAYHNLNHIADCLALFDEHRHLATNPVSMEFAIWFHDVVYDTHASDNEERSATARPCPRKIQQFAGAFPIISHARICTNV